MDNWSSPTAYGRMNPEATVNHNNIELEGASSTLVPDAQNGNTPIIQMGPEQLPAELSGIQLTMMEFSNTVVTTEGGGKMEGNTPPPASPDVGRPVRQCRQRTTRFTPY